MEVKKMKSISIRMSVTGDGVWQEIPVSQLTINIDDPGSYDGLVANIKNAMVAIRTQLDTMQRIDPNELAVMWKTHSAAHESEKKTEEKYKEGGSVWDATNRANKAESENACLKKQVEQLIEQLGRNIEQERKDGVL